MCPNIFLHEITISFKQFFFLSITNTSTTAMITFFESVRFRHSQFHLVTRESFLPTYPTGNNPQYKSAHYSERNDRFEPKNEVSAPTVLFDSTEEFHSIDFDNKTEERITVYKNTTIGFTDFLPKAVIKNNTKLRKSLPASIKVKKYDLNILKKYFDRDVPNRFHDQFRSFVKKFSDIFSKSEWD